MVLPSPTRGAQALDASLRKAVVGLARPDTRRSLHVMAPMAPGPVLSVHMPPFLDQDLVADAVPHTCTMAWVWIVWDRFGDGVDGRRWQLTSPGRDFITAAYTAAGQGDKLNWAGRT